MTTLDLRMYGVIGEDVLASKIVDQIEGSDADVIVVHLNSDGGDLIEGNVIYNALKRSGKRIEVEVDGVAASAASLIAMAGDEIRIAENGMLMIHEPWGAADGSADDHESLAALLRKHTAMMAETYAARSGQKPDAIKKMMADETWFTATDAIKFGFADGAIPTSKVAACIRHAKRFKKLPKALRKVRASDGLSMNEIATAASAVLRDLFPSDDSMSCGPYVCDVFESTLVYELEGKLYEAPYTMAGSTVTLGQAVEVKRSYQPLAAPIAAKAKRIKGATMDPKLITEALDALEAGDSAKALEILKALISSAAGGAAPADGGDGTQAADAPMDPEKEKEMVAALGRAAVRAKLVSDVAKLTGETEPAKVLAVLTALKSGADEGGKLAVRLSALESDATKREIDELIRLNTKKIPPTLEAWARTQSVEALTTFLKHAPEIKATANPDTRAVPAEITETAAAICERNKLDPKKFSDLRAQMRRGRVG